MIPAAICLPRAMLQTDASAFGPEPTRIPEPTLPSSILTRSHGLSGSWPLHHSKPMPCHKPPCAPTSMPVPQTCQTCRAPAVHQRRHPHCMPLTLGRRPPTRQSRVATHPTRCFPSEKPPLLHRGCLAQFLSPLLLLTFTLAAFARWWYTPCVSNTHAGSLVLRATQTQSPSLMKS